MAKKSIDFSKVMRYTEYCKENTETQRKVAAMEQEIRLETNEQRVVEALLYAKYPATSEQLAEMAGMLESDVQNVLKELVKRDEVSEKEGRFSI